MSYSFIDLVIETLKVVKKPLTAKEIWENALRLNISRKIDSNGKTPWATIGAKIYIDIRDNINTKFIQVSKRPAKFYLKELYNDNKIKEIENFTKNKKNKFNERELHPLLVKFLYSNSHFKCYSKTIYHELSSRRKKGYNEWLHPDLVGVYFPFKDYLGETQKLQEAFKMSSFKLYSFEIKIKLTFSDLREYYFQAVSNSSWANEGYLVALDMEDDVLLRDELRRLNNSFGIGIILLNSSEIEQSEIILPSKENDIIDWDTIDRLAGENKNFKDFICNLTEDIEVGKVKSIYDKVLSDDDYLDYVKNKKII
ncbi:HrgA protein [Clostridium tyrobutyricum]|uniref:COG2958 family protein n=1 Tax=Clostridium tyrobutyricum TaxID=1519 RepID=UPI001C391ECC|nr:HTH domain-containing protein [Clostridium tyrobutyricum]MBV4418928.1 HrgA protein [Clostridium tyrobutyricum]